VRVAVAKSREARLRAVERRLGAYLRLLRRRDPNGHAALVAMLRRVATVTRWPFVQPRCDGKCPCSIGLLHNVKANGAMPDHGCGRPTL
jgi:hypothetical protein